MPAASFLDLSAGKFAHSYLSLRRSMMTWLSGPHLTPGWELSITRIRVVPDFGTPPVQSGPLSTLSQIDIKYWLDHNVLL